ncbi:MAG: hypothetical protein KKD28_04495 [Chloroflexi bacterium]|nr:hypothetical protein [Chloroflexota bacterium]MBU1660713.1 hypothetical protein [Chloroflexota bacterium]
MKWTQRIQEDKKTFWAASFFLLVVSALVYLPKITSFGYYNDDWYLMYDAYIQGPSIYHEVFSSDRPLRAYVMISSYHLFGFNPFYYNLSAYFFRLLGGIGLLWILRLLWPQQKRATLAMAVLFLIYPGFLSQHNGIDYQSQMISLAFALLSIAFTIKAITERPKVIKIVFFLLSILLGWIYLGLVEYFIGFEVFRFGTIVLLASRKKEKLLHKGMMALREGWPVLLISLAFLLWRIISFDNERRATSLSAQFGQLIISPIHTGLWWSVHLFQGILEVIFLAWGVPLYSLAFNLRLRDFLTGIGLAGILVFLVLFALSWLVQDNDEDEDEDEDEDLSLLSTNWRKEALWLGTGSVLGGILPIIMVNRHIDFSSYSRYTLGSAAGSAIVIIALLYFLNDHRLKASLIGLMVLSSSLTHYANATQLAMNTEATNYFWWQLSWRAPHIQEETTMVVEYPYASLSEDYIIWGAANLLYYPDISAQISLNTKLSAVLLTPENIINITTGQGESEGDGRGYQSTRNYRNILVATQATSNGCVRIIDGEHPDLSSFDSYRIQLVAPYSKIDNLLSEEKPKIPLEVIFGPEPSHRWCFYYQKASLARQQGDWDHVIMLQETALKEGYYPGDSIEWMPLLEAYTRQGETEKLHPYISILREEPFLTQQACQILSEAANGEEMQNFIEKKFCE